MIELYSQGRLVEESGRLVSLDVDGLVREVRAACAAAGIADAWLAEQMALAVDDFFLARSGSGGEPGDAPPQPAPTRGDVDRMVAGTLLAAGYADVAAAYLKGRNLPLLADGPDAPPALPWDIPRLTRLLQPRLPLPEALLQGVVERVGAKLEDLNFREITDGLVLELAAHVLRDRALFLAGAPPDGSPWLVEPRPWMDALGGDCLRLCRAGVLRAHPVSRLLPTARVALDLAALAPGFGGGPLTELQVFPELRRTARIARRLLLQMRETIQDQVEVTPDMPVRLDVAGFHELVDKHWVPLGRAERRRLRAEMNGLLREVIEPGLGCPLLLGFPE